MVIMIAWEEYSFFIVSNIIDRYVFYYKLDAHFYYIHKKVYGFDYAYNPNDLLRIWHI